ncbi:MAG: hypothetical protein A2792_05075 [Sphingomonadales bacterium RIFCSPHIGHO2_01_FULL_65_20]|nr:MAG: hypothetical protein A2792_05075 [Sphingomonadales bacterium RIFCSPHIGHO2_01_FULL_65_20]
MALQYFAQQLELMAERMRFTELHTFRKTARQEQQRFSDFAFRLRKAIEAVSKPQMHFLLCTVPIGR